MCSKNIYSSHSIVGLKIVPQIMEEINQKRRSLSRLYAGVKREDAVAAKPGHSTADAPITHAHVHSRPFRTLRPTTSLPPEREAGREILDILLCKANSESLNLHHFGSPPCRAGNPLIHNAHFCQGEPSPSSVTVSCDSSPLSRGDRCAGNSSGSFSVGVNKTFIRIEGFTAFKGESNLAISTFA